MRLWHYKLLRFLPNSQLIAQWRELNSIYAKEDRHILINYIYDYDKSYLLEYSNLVLDEMKSRGIAVQSLEKYTNYFIATVPSDNTFHYPEHNNEYLLQCFYNLQEKFDRGQKDFTPERYCSLLDFVEKESETWMFKI